MNGMNARLKILFLSNRLPFPVQDGQSRRTYNILKGLARNHDVYFLSLYEGKEDPGSGTGHFKSFCSDVEYIPSPPKKISLSMVVRLLRSLVSTDPYTIWRHYSPEYTARIQSLLLTRSFDVVHCDILPLAYTLRYLQSVPCALTNHDVCHVKALRISKQSGNPLLKAFSRLESWKLRNFERKIFRQVNTGIAVSDIDKKILQKLCPDGNFEVVENGVDVKDFAPRPDAAENRTLLWIGGCGYSPNRVAVEFFVKDIYPLIKKELPDVKFNIVGNGVTGRLKKICLQDPSIHLLGYVDDPVPYLQKATVFVVPILSGSGTRLKTLEAMAAEKAIVTTSIGCEGIAGTDKMHYLVADSPSAFARSVLSLIGNPELRKKLGENARLLMVQKYDWDIISEKISMVYEKLKKSNNRVQ